MESLYSTDDVFLIDIDHGQNLNASSRVLRWLKPWSKLDNVHIRLDANVGWGASGILRKTLQGAFKLLELDKSWRYYINLSGQDLPLKSNAQIKKVLAAGDEQGTNFIRCFEADPITLESVKVDNIGRKSMLWGDRGHTRLYAKPGAINPQVNMYARTFVDVAEAGEDGAVFFGTVDPLLHIHRQTFFKKHPFYIGSNWFNLHRDLIRVMHNDPFTGELYSLLKTTSNPDESFFQTYLMNSDFRETVDKDYSRLIVRPGPVPRVKIFDRHDWDLINESAALFGRKFDTRRNRKIVKRVLQARQEPGAVTAPKARRWNNFFTPLETLPASNSRL